MFADRVISLIPQLLGSVDGHQVQHFVSDSVSKRARRHQFGPFAWRGGNDAYRREAAPGIAGQVAADSR